MVSNVQCVKKFLVPMERMNRMVEKHTREMLRHVRAMLQSEWVAVEMESGGVDGGGSSGGGSSGGVSNYSREECQCRIA